MTIDIITALDQAFFQAETAENDDVRKHAIQHFINVAGIMEQQLQVAGIKEVRIGGESVVAVPTEQPTLPKPDVIDMSDPHNWQAGDVVKRR